MWIMDFPRSVSLPNLINASVLCLTLSVTLQDTDEPGLVDMLKLIVNYHLHVSSDITLIFLELLSMIGELPS